ncbi:SIMPL domain-containing protein [Planctomycetota bacterium]
MRNHPIRIATVFAWLLMAAALPAQTSTRTIRVTGTGRVPVKPTEIELKLAVAGSAELAEEALKKYNQSLKQAKMAFDNLKMENLAFTPLGVSVKQVGQNPNQIFNGQPQQETKIPVTFGREVRVTLSGVADMNEDELAKTLVKLIDTAKDSGAAIKTQDAQMARIYGMQMTNAMAFFVVNGVDDAREKSYEQAMDVAKRRAVRLAKLSGTKVGKVHTISESFNNPEDTGNAQMRFIYAMYGMQEGKKDEKRVLSSEYKDVDVVVTLTVEFEID